MKTAFISVTNKGRELTKDLMQRSEFGNTKRFCFHKASDDKSESFDDIKKLTETVFRKYDALVFVCACGIAVRAIAPFVDSKLTDPAVIVIDDCGKYVIPILSGHIGGANELAKKTAELIDAKAVITTATDNGKLFSPDSFAVSNGLIIDDMSAAKEIACAVINNEKIGIKSEYGYKNAPSYIIEDDSCRTGMYIGTESREPFEVTLKLIPKNIVLGIGCKKDSSIESISEAAKAAFEKAGKDMRRLCAVTSIDIKAHEKGLLEFCKMYDVMLVTYTADELMKTEGEFEPSDFVRSVTGADNVCERSAVRYGGKLILKKQILNGVTAALAEMPVTIDLEKERF